jgi:hypothetical protein
VKQAASKAAVKGMNLNPNKVSIWKHGSESPRNRHIFEFLCLQITLFDSSSIVVITVVTFLSSSSIPVTLK